MTQETKYRCNFCKKPIDDPSEAIGIEHAIVGACHSFFMADAEKTEKHLCPTCHFLLARMYRNMPNPCGLDE